MYVCICNGHSDRDIKRVAQSGVSCARDIYIQLGKPMRCGRCIDMAEELVQKVHESTIDNHKTVGTRR
ncbi:MAG: (2Fe-2S)-binding protein [Gammaproteobacteria bacterium]|nr:(2Fe-2S)-binding protein [Gammaproteobacteria bacterium]